MCVCVLAQVPRTHVCLISSWHIISLTACMCALSGNEYVNPGYSISVFYFHSGPPVKRQRLDHKLISELALRELGDKVMTDAPNFKRLMKNYNSCKRGNLFETLIAIGPKGCGKTTCLQLFLKAMKEMGKGDGCVAIDLALVAKPLDIYLDPDRIHTLVVDNVQLHSAIKFPIPRGIFVVAASSPGGNAAGAIDAFIKYRGDGTCKMVYMCPLDLHWSEKLFKCHGVVVEHDEDSSPTTEVEGAGPSATEEKGGGVVTFTWKEFLEVFYKTGGIPRYLVYYLAGHDHQPMRHELNNQLVQLSGAFKEPSDLVKHLLQIAITSEVTGADKAVMYGIAYLIDENKCIGHLSSPMYVNTILHWQPDLLITSSADWQRLEFLTMFMVKYINCTITNGEEETSLPRPLLVLNQKEMGTLPELGERPECVISLVYKHPVVDTLLISHSMRSVYFIQTSFSKYSKHKRKRRDLHEKVGGITCTKYMDSVTDYKLVYVYATPQKDSHKDKKVFFLNLSCAVLRWNS